MTKQQKAAAEKRWASTVAKLEPERQARAKGRQALEGALVRRQAALDTRAEVEAAERAVDPDAALVARLEAERRERLGL